MNKNYKSFLSVLLLMVTALIAACNDKTAAAPMEEMDMDAPLGELTDNDHADEDNHADGESMHHAHAEVPDEFASLVNPYTDDHEAIEAGEETYNTLCATCHGADGNGDGVAAETLDPKPAKLADVMMMGELSDGYLYWRVSKGGMMEPFHSAMPSWEAGLTENQRWQVISYVRTLAGDENGHTEGDHHMDDDHHEDNDEHDD